MDRMLEKGLRFTEMRRNDWMGVMRWVFGGLGLAALLVGCKYPLEVRQDKAELAFYIEEFSQPGVQVLEMSYYRANPTKVTVNPRPVLVANSGMLKNTELIDSSDGLFAMQLNFTTRGQRLMEELTTYYRDRRLFIVAAQSDSSQTNGVSSRCIGAAYIQQTIQAEAMQFTPDAERAEAERLVELINKTLE
tara:strand:+ start:35 stop:607 length:573 start_codon:yes stop_codon:yes gene_type:complete